MSPNRRKTAVCKKYLKRLKWLYILQILNFEKIFKNIDAFEIKKKKIMMRCLGARLCWSPGGGALHRR